MTHQSSSEPKVPSALVNRSRNDWHMFTKAIVINCVAVAGLLLVMLLVFKIL
jgi:hypothetical protein